MKSLFKMKNSLFFSVVLAASFVSPIANAIAIDKMVAFSNSKGEANLTITNTATYRQFINVGVSSVKAEKGELIIEPYTRDNIQDWEIEVWPARTIIDPAFRKTIGVRNLLPLKPRAEDEDRMFQLAIIPTPYIDESEKKSNNPVQITFGFAPLIIVPAKETPSIQYELAYLGDKLEIFNRGKGFFHASFDTCDDETLEEEKEACAITVLVLAGRRLLIDLPEGMVNQKELRVSLVSYGNKFNVKTIYHYKNDKA